MQERFERFSLHYERKARQFDKAPNVDASRIAPNELVAQSYLAVVMKKPSDARRRKYKVWGELYDKIFSGKSAIEPYVASFYLQKLAAKWLRTSGNTEENDDLTRRLAKNGVFHVARIASFFWRDGDEWGGLEDDLVKQIEKVEKKPAELDAHFSQALEAFKKIVSGNPQYSSDIDGAMKSTNLDDDIDRFLYQNKAKVAAKESIKKGATKRKAVSRAKK